MVQAKPVSRLRRARRFPRDELVGRAGCLLRTAQAKHLTSALLAHQAIRVQVSREGRAKLLERQPRPLGLCQEPLPGSLLRARPRALAVGYSSDFGS